MRGLFVLIGCLLFSQSALAETKAEIFDYCMQRNKQTESFCNCMLGSPYDAYVAQIAGREKEKFEQSKKYYQDAEERLLADPTINKAQFEQICDVADEVYRFADTFPAGQNQKHTPPKASPDMRKEYGALTKRASAQMHDMLHAGKMSTPVYRAMSSLSGICKSRYDMAKKEQQALEYERNVAAGNLEVDARLFFHFSKKDAVSCR